MTIKSIKFLVSCFKMISVDYISDMTHCMMTISEKFNFKRAGKSCNMSQFPNIYMCM